MSPARRRPPWRRDLPRAPRLGSHGCIEPFSRDLDWSPGTWTWSPGPGTWTESLLPRVALLCPGPTGTGTQRSDPGLRGRHGTSSRLSSESPATTITGPGMPLTVAVAAAFATQMIYYDYGGSHRGSEPRTRRTAHHGYRRGITTRSLQIGAGAAGLSPAPSDLRADAGITADSGVWKPCCIHRWHTCSFGVKIGHTFEQLKSFRARCQQDYPIRCFLYCRFIHEHFGSMLQNHNVRHCQPDL